MPGPSLRPLLGAFGTFMLMLGLVFPGWLLAVGVIALILTLVGWLTDANREYRADRRGRPDRPPRERPAPRPPSLLFAALVILLVLGVALQAGWLPPTSASAEPVEPGGLRGTRWRPAGSGRPIGSGGSGGPPPASGAAADVTLTAQNIAFDTTPSPRRPASRSSSRSSTRTRTAPQRRVQGRRRHAFFKGESSRRRDEVYDVPALPAGSYTFMCTVHPTMTGTVTFQ